MKKNLKTLSIWVQKNATKAGDLVFIYLEEDEEFYTFLMNNEDGYRSYCDEYEGNISKLEWVLGILDEKSIKIQYDEIKFNFDEKRKGQYSEEDCHFDIRAKKDDKIVFEIGTDNSDDYYPNYFMIINEKEWKDWGDNQSY